MTELPKTEVRVDHAELQGVEDFLSAVSRLTEAQVLLVSRGVWPFAAGYRRFHRTCGSPTVLAA